MRTCTNGVEDTLSPLPEPQTPLSALSFLGVGPSAAWVSCPHLVAPLLTSLALLLDDCPLGLSSWSPGICQNLLDAGTALFPNLDSQSC